MSEPTYKLDAYCGQCGAPKGSFVALGPWNLVYWARAQFLDQHGMHTPVEMKTVEMGKEETGVPQD